MQFQVPQFTDVEDKIIGPLTLKQFIYLGGAGGICVVIYTFVPTGLNFLLMAPVAIFGGLLAFYKKDGKSFVQILEAFLKYTLASKLYVWKKEPKSTKEKEEERRSQEVSEPEEVTPKLSKNKLRELANNLDIQDINTSLKERG